MKRSTLFKRSISWILSLCLVFLAFPYVSAEPSNSSTAVTGQPKITTKFFPGAPHRVGPNSPANGEWDEGSDGIWEFIPVSGDFVESDGRFMLHLYPYATIDGLEPRIDTGYNGAYMKCRFTHNFMEVSEDGELIPFQKVEEERTVWVSNKQRYNFYLSLTFDPGKTYAMFTDVEFLDTQHGWENSDYTVSSVQEDRGEINKARMFRIPVLLLGTERAALDTYLSILNIDHHKEIRSEESEILTCKVSRDQLDENGMAGKNIWVKNNLLFQNKRHIYVGKTDIYEVDGDGRIVEPSLVRRATYADILAGRGKYYEAIALGYIRYKLNTIYTLTYRYSHEYIPWIRFEHKKEDVNLNDPKSKRLMFRFELEDDPVITESSVMLNGYESIRKSVRQMPEPKPYEISYHYGCGEMKSDIYTQDIGWKFKLDPASSDGKYTVTAKLYETHEANGTNSTSPVATVTRDLTPEELQAGSAVLWKNYRCKTDQHYYLEAEVTSGGASLTNKDKQDTNPTRYTCYHTFVVKAEEYCNSGGTDPWYPPGNYQEPKALSGTPKIRTEVEIGPAYESGTAEKGSDGVWVFKPAKEKISGDGKIRLTVKDKVMMDSFPTADGYEYTTNPLKYRATGKIVELGSGEPKTVVEKPWELSFHYSDANTKGDTVSFSYNEALSLEVGKTYVVYQVLELQSDSTGYYDAANSAEAVKTIRHEDPTEKSQMFRIEDPRTPNPGSSTDPSSAQPTVETVVSIAGQKASKQKILTYEVSADKVKNGKITLNVTDKVVVRNAKPQRNYEVSSWIYEVKDGAVATDSVASLSWDVQSDAQGSFEKSITFLSAQPEKDKTYLVVHKFTPEGRYTTGTGSGSGSDDSSHAIVHKDANDRAQTFRVMVKQDSASTPNPPQPNPGTPSPNNPDGPNTPNNPDSENPSDPVTPKPSDPDNKTTDPSKPENQTTEATKPSDSDDRTSTPNPSGDSNSPSDPENPSDASADSDVVRTTAAESVAASFAIPTTAPQTTRTFEFVEIEEDVPLGVRTTAPLDLEQILIEEDVPLGGVPYAYNTLPYTGMAGSELYFGIGLFMISLGVAFYKKRG